jgi:phytoene dehydrogenase-like protein
MQIPTVMDPILAPDGFHVATTYGFFFPCEAPKEERGRLRDEMAERILDRLSEFLPDLRECIVERAVFSSEHFATMQGATNGDFTHGLIHQEQMIAGRLLGSRVGARNPDCAALSVRGCLSSWAGCDVSAGIWSGLRGDGGAGG